MKKLWQKGWFKLVVISLGFGVTVLLSELVYMTRHRDERSERLLMGGLVWAAKQTISVNEEMSFWLAKRAMCVRLNFVAEYVDGPEFVSEVCQVGSISDDEVAVYVEVVSEFDRLLNNEMWGGGLSTFAFILSNKLDEKDEELGLYWRKVALALSPWNGPYYQSLIIRYSEMGRRDEGEVMLEDCQKYLKDVEVEQFCRLDTKVE